MRKHLAVRSSKVVISFLSCGTLLITPGHRLPVWSCTARRKCFYKLWSYCDAFSNCVWQRPKTLWLQYTRWPIFTEISVLPLASALPVVGLRSTAKSAGLAEIAVRLCLNQRKHLCPHLWVPILKPQRPCIRPPVSVQLPADILNQVYMSHPILYFLDDLDDDEILLPIRNKRVVFADSCGLSLAAVRVFSDEEEQSDLDPLLSLQDLGSMTEDGYSCTVSTCCPGTQLKLCFPQPSADFQAFRAKLAKSMVTLENCSISEQALQGTVRVRNVSFQKDVRVRITFDSWRSYRDIPCTYLQERFGGPQTDIFEFEIAIPKVLDAKRKIEFCLMYLPGGHSEPFWDSNKGQNYSVAVCVSSHLCCGKSLSERAWFTI